MIESEEWIDGLNAKINSSVSVKKKIKLTENESALLKNNLKYLEDNFEWFKDFASDGEYDGLLEEGYEDGNTSIDLPFPAEDDYYNIEIDDFNTYIDEYKTLSFVDNIYITNKYAYLKVIPNFTEENYNLYMENCGEVFTTSDISVSYDEGCFIPALDIIQEQGYDEDRGIYPSWHNHYLVIEKHGGAKLTKEECIYNINIYKYLAETKLGLSFIDDTSFYKDSDNESDEEFILEGDYIKDYPMDCIKDYIEAKAITNLKVRYTLLFRVLEYISVSSNHAELLKNVNTKLEEFEGKSIKGTDIKEIVGIIKSKKITDDYIKTLLDIIPIESFIGLLPIYIKDKVFDGTDIDIKKLSSFLTNTRHRYSHAKPNYNIKENECKDEDIEEFNIFIDKLVQESIDWYINLDDYLKIK